MTINTTSLESLLARFRMHQSLEVAEIERLVLNGRNIGMTTGEVLRARRLVGTARQSSILYEQR